MSCWLAFTNADFFPDALFSRSLCAPRRDCLSGCKIRHTKCTHRMQLDVVEIVFDRPTHNTITCVVCDTPAAGACNIAIHGLDATSCLFKESCSNPPTPMLLNKPHKRPIKPELLLLTQSWGEWRCITSPHIYTDCIFASCHNAFNLKTSSQQQL